MSSSIRITNFPQTATQETMHSLFLSFGNILTLSPNKNYIDIQFQEIEDAHAALQNMDGFKLYDKYLHVSQVSEKSVLDSLEKNRAVWDKEEVEE